MSSKYVRDEVKSFLSTNFSSTKLLDLSAEYMEIEELMVEENILPDDAWMAIQFIGDSEEPITISATNTEGCYRERGAFFLHIIEPVQRSAIDNIITRGETLVSAFRGKRINQVVIESINPLNTSQGATLEFSGGYASGSIFLHYYRDKNL